MKPTQDIMGAFHKGRLRLEVGLGLQPSGAKQARRIGILGLCTRPCHCGHGAAVRMPSCSNISLQNEMISSRLRRVGGTPRACIFLQIMSRCFYWYSTSGTVRSRGNRPQPRWGRLDRNERHSAGTVAAERLVQNATLAITRIFF
jgi:hypothetical protein